MLKSKIIGIFLIVILFSGCETAKEYSKGFLGISTKALEDNRKNAVVKDFDMDYDTCYKMAKEGLIARRTYIYAEDRKKGMIAVYASGDDTVAVGVFFQKIDNAKTRVEVSSTSIYAKELVSGYVFAALRGEVYDKKAELPSE
ncbi:MAG: hypothetical protein WC628_00945 [Candidatus Omnitrophota bacterium]